MPKSILLEPRKLLAKDRIRFTDIRINAYNKTIEEEKALCCPT